MSVSTSHRPAGRVTPAAPSSASRGLTVGRRLGAVAAVGALATLVVTGVTFVGLGQVEQDKTDMSVLAAAQKTLLALDTRSSELKVDAYKAAVRPDAAEQHAELADDTATAQELLDSLVTLPLTGELAEQVDGLEDTYDAYVEGIGDYIETAVVYQAAARAAYEEIQTANDGLDDVLGAAIDTGAAQETEAEDALSSAVDRVQLLTLLATVLGLFALAGLALLVPRGITRPLARVQSALEALASGDLTSRT